MPKDLPLLCCSNSRQSIEKTENDLLKIYLVAFYLLSARMLAISLFVFFLEVISSGKNTAVPITAHRCPLVRKVNGDGSYSVRYGCSLVYHGSECENKSYNVQYTQNIENNIICASRLVYSFVVNYTRSLAQSNLSRGAITVLRKGS